MIWQNSLISTLDNNTPIQGSSLWNVLSRMSQEDLKFVFAMMAGVTAKYQLPPGKIFLAKAYHELVLGECVSYSPEHIVLLLYSLNRPEPSFRPAKPLVFPSSTETDGAVSIKFGKSKLKTDPDVIKTLQTIKHDIAYINRNSPGNPLDNVFIESDSFYFSSHLSPWGIHILRHDAVASTREHTMMHEGGHWIFHRGYSRISKNRQYSDDAGWNNIYALSLCQNRHLAFKDSSYQRNIEKGHPHDNPDELFASCFSIFTLEPELLLKNMTDPDTPPGLKLLANMIYAYMRGNIVHGVFVDREFIPLDSEKYSANSSLPKESWEELQKQILPADVNLSLAEALADGTDYIVTAALKYIDFFDLIADEDFVRVVAPLLYHSDSGVRAAASRLLLKADLSSSTVINMIMGFIGGKDRIFKFLIDREPDKYLNKRTVSLILNGMHNGAGTPSAGLVAYKNGPDRSLLSQYISSASWDTDIENKHSLLFSAMILGPKSPEALKILDNGIIDDSREIQSDAASIIMHSGLRSAHYTDLLLTLMRSGVKSKILNSLGSASDAAVLTPELSDQVLELMENNDPEIAERAYEAARDFKLFDDRVKAACLRGIRSSSEAIRILSAVALSEHGMVSQDIRNELLRALIIPGSDFIKYVAANDLRGYKLFGDPAAISLLYSVVNIGNFYVRLAVARKIGREARKKDDILSYALANLSSPHYQGHFVYLLTIITSFNIKYIAKGLWAINSLHRHSFGLFMQDFWAYTKIIFATRAGLSWLLMK